ncbi:MAG: hypothetical protein KDC88_16955, partial [Ignavibacteriae bacterium]|nr:hypothetical protein [Ignavibacteriota bacterium]
MKYKNFFITLIISVLMNGFLIAQDIIEIASGQANAGLLETTINNDVDGSGNRLSPNRIYKLMPGIHYQLAPINVDNPTGTIRIVGDDSGKKPVIIPIATNDIGPEGSVINGSLEMKNVHYQNYDDIGGGVFARFELQGLNRKLTVEDCLFEFAQHQVFFCDNVTQGLVLEFRNNYFRDLFWDDQWWASRVFQAKVPIDTLIFENNTVTGSGMALLQQEAVCNYALINHNSFINNHGYVILNNYYFEAYFTNNLFYNCQIKGEDSTVIKLEPDVIPTCIMGLDTIDTDILLADYMVDGSGNLIAPYNDIGNYKVYASNNIYFNESTLDPYYNGTYNSMGWGAPVSYLNWFGEGPWKVYVPTPWMNERAKKLYADWPNIVEENTILDQDPQLNTEALSAEDAEQLAIWNRRQYAVPDETRIPDLSGYLFGDGNPLTIPGVETEDGDGITKFSDLVEDLSYSANIKSTLDGHSIGALHWTDEISSFDPDESLASILQGYNNAVGGTEEDIIEIQ